MQCKQMQLIQPTTTTIMHALHSILVEPVIPAAKSFCDTEVSKPNLLSLIHPSRDQGRLRIFYVKCSFLSFASPMFPCVLHWLPVSSIFWYMGLNMPDSLLPVILLSHENPTSEEKIPVNGNVSRYDILLVAFHKPYNDRKTLATASTVNWDREWYAKSPPLVYGLRVDCELADLETFNCKIHQLVIGTVAVPVRKSHRKPQGASEQAILIDSRKAFTEKDGSSGMHVMVLWQ